MKFISHSEQETIDFAKKFAKKLKGGEVIGLIGNLGAGKTAFTKGLAQGLGIKTRITSPTFVLMRVYPVRGHASIKTFIHVDAYRLESILGLETTGLEEYLNKLNCLIIIEWADNIKKIQFDYSLNFKASNNNRIINY